MVVDFGYEFKDGYCMTPLKGSRWLLSMHAMAHVRAASEEEVAAGKDELLARIKAANAVGYRHMYNETDLTEVFFELMTMIDIATYGENHVDYD